MPSMQPIFPPRHREWLPIPPGQDGHGRGPVQPARRSGWHRLQHLIHFGADKFGVHVAGVTDTQAVATQVFQLLDGPDSGFSNPLPGILADGTGAPTTVPGRGNGLDQQDFAKQCGAGGPMKQHGPVQKAPSTALPSGQQADGRVQVTSPNNGQEFAPGDTVNITVAITPPLTATDIAVDVPRIDNTGRNQLRRIYLSGELYHSG